MYDTLQIGDHVGVPFTGCVEFAVNSVAIARQAIAAGAGFAAFPSPDAWTQVRNALADASDLPADAMVDGRIQLLDSKQTLLAPGRFDPVHLHQLYSSAAAQAVAEGHTGLWASVDMSWAGPGITEAAAICAFEATAFPLFSAGRLTAVCQYDTNVFPAGAVAAACGAHPVALEGAILRHRPVPDGGLQLSGETDLSNHAAFAAMIDSLDNGDTIDITGLTFIDAAGLACLANAHHRHDRLLLVAIDRHYDLLDMLTGRRAAPSRAGAGPWTD